jgi:hypothetical protein
MMKVFAPREVRPPYWNNNACRANPMRMAGNAVQPSKSPQTPERIKWTAEGPIGTCTKEATKKTDDRTATSGSLS